MGRLGFNHRLLRCVAVLVIGSSLGFGGALAVRAYKVRTSAPGLRIPSNPELGVDSDDLDLGSVYEADELQHSLRVSNRTDSEIAITDFVKSCNCITISPTTPVLIPAHGTARVNLSLDLTSKRPPGVEELTEPLRIELIAKCLTSTNETFSMTWPVRGTLLPTFWIDQPVVQLGMISEKQPATRFQLPVKLSGNVHAVSFEPQKHWRVTQIDEQGDSKSGTVMEISQLEARPLGEFSDWIRIVPIGRNNNPLPAKSIHVMGEVVRDVVPRPRELHFDFLPSWPHCPKGG